MNLKDRIKSGYQNSTDTMPRLKQSSLELDLLKKQSEALQQVTEERDKLLMNGRSEDQETIQTLSSKISTLKSIITELKTELSLTQKLNQSLSQNNHELRSTAGIMSWNHQSQLEMKCNRLMNENAELKKWVSMSNIKAVKAASQQAEEAKKARDKAIQEAKKLVASARKNQSIAWGALLFTLLCCLMINQTFINDLAAFFTVSASRLVNSLRFYVEWLREPYYLIIMKTIEKRYVISFKVIWFLRILTPFLILAVLAGIGYGAYRLGRYYKKRWCNLSLKVVLATLSIILVFGRIFRKHLPINLLLLFFLIQTIYLGVLVYFDGYFDSRSRTSDWEWIQNA